MEIVERIRQLCSQNNISIAALERQLWEWHHRAVEYSFPHNRTLGKGRRLLWGQCRLPHRPGRKGNPGQSVSQLSAPSTEPGHRSPGPGTGSQYDPAAAKARWCQS